MAAAAAVEIRCLSYSLTQYLIYTDSVYAIFTEYINLYLFIMLLDKTAHCLSYVLLNSWQE